MIKNIARIFLVIFAVGLWGCATAPKPVELPKGQAASLRSVCSQHNISYSWDNVSQIVMLKKDNFQAKLLVGSEMALVADTAVLLSAPVRMEKSVLVVPADFKEKVIDRFFQQPAAVQEKHVFKMAREIVVDAGHGGKDPGAMSRSGLKEKDIVLDISKHLRKILERHGIKVKMTRSKDEFISLNERTEIASRSKADLFVSIHANSHPSRSVQGMEVYSLKDLDHLDKKEEQRKINHGVMFKNLKMVDDKAVKDMVEDMLYVYKQAESGPLAKQIARKASNMVQAKNLGHKNARFVVLRNTLIPAVLVEVGFVTNPQEERLLRTGEYRQKMARAVAMSILEYLGYE